MIRPVRADGRIDAGGVFTPIYRARVVDRIAAAAESRVVLIVAPAGYGKSTALRQYLDGVSDQVVRYDLHSDNGSLLGFVRGFADAISEIAPDARKTLSTAYESARDSLTAGTELAMWMHAHIKTYNGTIAIDDLHQAEHEKQVSAFIASLVERTKGRVRWIVASRSFLDLPVGSWLAYQEMDLAIDESDLAFTAEEARSTARASRVGVRDEELESLVALTSGWPTALSFALRTSTRSLDLRNVQAVTREMVYRYLAEQVYEALDDADRRLLSDCALLPEIEIDVLEAAGYDDALGMIEALRHRVAFIAPHADRARVYRMHDLFRDFVLNRLDLEGAEAVAKRRIGIARAFEKHGEYAGALSAFAQSEAYEDVERLLNGRAMRLFEEGHGDAIQDGISALRASGRREPAVSIALRGLLEASAGHFEEAETLLRRATQRTDNDAARSQFDLCLARVMINRGADATETLRGVRDNASVDVDSRGEAASLLAVTYARSSHAAEARDAIEFAEGAAEATEVAGVRARILQRLAVGVSELGDNAKAVSYLAIATDIAVREGLLSLASRAYTGLAFIMSEYEDDRAKHLWYSQQAYLTAVKSGDRLDMQTSTLHLMSAEAKRGNAERVVALERQLGELRTSDALRLKYAASSRALRRAWEGAFGEAFRIMSDLWPQIIPVSNQLMNGATCAVYAAADGRTGEASKIVSQVLAIEMDEERSGLVSTFNRAIPVLFCALAEGMVGRHTAATRALKRVAESSNPQIECFRGAIARALRVLRSKAAEEAELADDLDPIRDFGFGGYAMLIQGAVSRVLLENAGAVRVSLTRAEVAVLKSLAAGLNPKEIAQESGRSIYTIQAHVQNAMEKLGCHGRHEAVVAAQRLGVIES